MSVIVLLNAVWNASVAFNGFFIAAAIPVATATAVFLKSLNASVTENIAPPNPSRIALASLTTPNSSSLTASRPANLTSSQCAITSTTAAASAITAAIIGLKLLATVAAITATLYAPHAATSTPKPVASGSMLSTINCKPSPTSSPIATTASSLAVTKSVN